jgi:tetratricopeptide (TPR) repeat protein
MPRQDTGAYDPHRPPAAPAASTVRTPDALPAHCLLVYRLKIVTLYTVVAVERAGSAAMGTAGLFQVFKNLFLLLFVAHKSDLFHRRNTVGVSRNAPCPCGSGNKYKKCCLAQDEKTAAEARHQRLETQERTDHMCPDCLDELDRLSNQANDLIRAERWDEAREACRRLAESFPDSIDVDERFSDYYKQRGDFRQALAHAEAALHRAEHPPAWYQPAPELLVDLREETAYLSECVQVGRLVD